MLIIRFRVFKGSLSKSSSYNGPAGYYSSINFSAPSISYVDKTITSNGTYTYNQGIGTITVNVPTPTPSSPSSSVSGTYYFSENSKGETTNIASYEYVNAENVYKKGLEDGSKPINNVVYGYPTRVVQAVGSSSNSNQGAQIYVRVSFDGKVKGTWASTSNNITMKIENITQGTSTTSTGSTVSFSPNDELCITARSARLAERADLTLSWTAD